ncbi:hypothetical protein [Psychroserpens algicola]|uniref:Uncharacterized protein n=1 Tax=Psychroserpens algicola TaxID=1719034 RepID=A0ABT0H879_9FLAO|nr:hypothetical protein [Psychroserpens algicola]MCK8480249.1 hypothetical protein [Psychroserpens algicola]
MKSKLSAIFFLLIFSALITAPSILVAIDDSIDITCFYTITEEEEESGHQISKEGKVFYQESTNMINYLKGFEKNRQQAYYFKNYPKPHLNLISPPPEFIL